MSLLAIRAFRIEKRFYRKSDILQIGDDYDAGGGNTGVFQMTK